MSTYDDWKGRSDRDENPPPPARCSECGDSIEDDGRTHALCDGCREILQAEAAEGGADE